MEETSRDLKVQIWLGTVGDFKETTTLLCKLEVNSPKRCIRIVANSLGILLA